MWIVMEKGGDLRVLVFTAAIAAYLNYQPRLNVSVKPSPS